MKLLFVLLACLSLFGCRRKRAEPSVPVPLTSEATAPATPVPTSAPATPVPAQPVRPVGPHPGEPASPNEVRIAYHKYFEKLGNFPNSWQDMVQRKFLPAVPVGKNGQPLDFVQFTLWEAGRPAR